MAVSHHTRKGKVRHHRNGTFGMHVNGKRIGLKKNAGVKHQHKK